MRDESPAVAVRASTWADRLSSYCVGRGLSSRQVSILTLYLAGKSDKEIAAELGCGTTTVQEHWRRMATKSNGRLKCDAIADFHRFLSADG